MSHIMVDLETLGVAPDGVILTVAAQSFDPFSDQVYDRSYYARIDLDSQPNRTITDSTVEWWAQFPEAAEEAFHEDNRLPIKQVLEELNSLLWKHEFVWSKGAFDFTILEHAFKEQGMPVPWKFWRVRDVRTVMSLWPDCPKPAVAHHALDDCKNQIKQLQQTLRHLGVTSIT